MANAAVADSGRLMVRVSGPDRQIIDGFDHADCEPFVGDATLAELKWKQRTLDELKGQPIRLDFFI